MRHAIMTDRTASADSLKQRIPAWPQRGPQEEDAVLRVVRSGQWWRGNGKEADHFEQEFAAFLGVKHALVTSSGSGALEIALQALDVRPGDEVIVPACTFIATASAVLRIGAWPIPVDVAADTLCMEPAAVEAAITPRTKCIVPVHMAGHAVDMDALMAIAAKHGLAVLEDAAHAHGATYKGRLLGTIGDASIFSFQSGKLMTAGEGGLIATNRDDVGARLFHLHSCGRPKGDTEYRHEEVAGNWRLSEFQSAVLRAQLTRLPEQLEKRREGIALFNAAMSKVAGVRPLVSDTNATGHSHYMAMFWFDPDAFGGADAGLIAQRLRKWGIPAFRCFPPVHRTNMFKAAALVQVGRVDTAPDYAAMRTPVSEAASRQVVWFQHPILLGDAELIADIAGAVADLGLALAEESDRIDAA
ncbi:MAG TPA: DegT/DnrJ/EryC1/StrS family aminotransferase [Rhizomicrobium sp.]|nr:DegT/DnrJ/EryC1/StrS family aminotransferase [Rhizomicrobium sp.]